MTHNILLQDKARMEKEAHKLNEELVELSEKNAFVKKMENDPAFEEKML